MHCSVTHHGVPIGTVELHLEGGRADGVVDVLPAYDAVRPVVRRASQVIADVRNDSAAARVDRRARFREAAELTRQLELRDDEGHVVAADYIILHDEAGAESPTLTAIGVQGG